MGRIFLITGPRGSGKTTLCRQFIELARARGWHVTGILTLKHTANSPGRAWSLHAQDLRTGETRPLAYRSPDGIRQWAFVEDADVGEQSLKISSAYGSSRCG